MIKYIWAKLQKKIRGAAIKNSEINPSSKIEAGSTVINSSFDKYSFCGYDCKIINTEIGSFCSIADSVVIGVAQHPINWVSTSPVFYTGRDSVTKKFSEFVREPSKKTIIGHDVWIGERAIIKAGVNIGTGAIIGMGAVVTKDVLPYDIVAGVPAKTIRSRFDKDTVENLINSKWWELDESILTNYAKYICDAPLFIEKLNNMKQGELQ